METDLQQVIVRAKRVLGLPVDQVSLSRSGVVVIEDADPRLFAARLLKGMECGRTLALLPHDLDEGRRDAIEKILRRYEESEYGKKVPEVLILTGGSGGAIRFARHRWKTLSSAAEGFRERFGEKMGTTVITLPLYHVSGLMAFIRALVCGGAVSWEDYRVLIKDASRLPEGGSLSLVPTQLERWLQADPNGENLKGLGGIFLGGAKMSADLAERARDRGLRLIPCYGMTETAAFVCALDSDAFLSGVEGCGRALGHAMISIDQGEVGIQSNSLCQGYWPEDWPFDPERFMTGDRGFFNDEGSLVIEGRKDRLINTGGEKVDPTRLERIFDRLLGEGRVVILGLDDHEWGERVVAAYDGKMLKKGMLEGLLSKVELLKHEIPKEWVHLDEIPRNALGKVLYGALKLRVERSLKRR